MNLKDFCGTCPRNNEKDPLSKLIGIFSDHGSKNDDDPAKCTEVCSDPTPLHDVNKEGEIEERSLINGSVIVLAIIALACISLVVFEAVRYRNRARRVFLRRRNDSRAGGLIMAPTKKVPLPTYDEVVIKDNEDLPTYDAAMQMMSSNDLNA